MDPMRMMMVRWASGRARLLATAVALTCAMSVSPVQAQRGPEGMGFVTATSTAGTMVGAGGAQQAQMSPRQRYDLAYAQCMYAHGDQVPGFTPAEPPPPPMR
jgi:hypothetical protein